MLSLIYVANKLFMLSAIKLIAVMLSVIMLIVIRLSVITLNVVMVNVVILSVVAPSVEPLYFMTYKQSESNHNQVKIS
jgi:hypothetical protein